MAKKKPAPAKKYYTVAVRFLSCYGSNPGMLYTYRVAANKKVHLGQELIADTPRGTALVVVARIDKIRRDTEGFDYQYLTRKVAPL